MEHKYINVLNPIALCPKNLLIKAYEFKISGYPGKHDRDNDKDILFNFPHVVSKKDCGLIRINTLDKNTKEYVLRSCDILDSDDIVIDNSDTINNILYTKCNAKRSRRESSPNCDPSKDLAERIINRIIETTQNMKKYININVKPNEYFIYKKQINKNTKVILIGDIHGGFHTFYRLLLRFREYGYITDYTVNKGYVVIFCGDVIDRGGYSIEILYLICKLLNNSNKLNDIRFIYNRGNHEHQEQFDRYGMGHEFDIKIKKYEIITYENYEKLLTNLYDYCPTATILHYGSKNIFVCHGGIPVKMNLDNDIKCYTTTQIIELNISDEFTKIDENIATQIMWNDFTMIDKTIPTDRDGYKNTMCAVGTTLLNKFMKHHNINLIIRGHQDSYANTVLFTTKTDKIDDHVIVSSEISSNSNDINILLKNNEKPKINKDNSVNGPIAIFDLNKFNNQDKYKKVITISSNTGNERYLTYDSFLLVENDI
jgi:hypothetical protein